MKQRRFRRQRQDLKLEQRFCPVSRWLVAEVSVDRFSTGVQTCPHCSATVQCERVNTTHVLIPFHFAEPAIVTRSVSS